MSHRRLALALALLACAPLACKKSTESTPLGAKGDLCSATAPCGGKLVCTDSPVGGTSTPGVTHCAAPGRHYTFRAIAGVSMGAAGSSRLAAAHPEAFDAVGMLGGPLDAALLLRTIEHEHFGGFCPADKLEAAVTADKGDGGNRLDRPDGIDGCTEANPTPSTQFSRSQRFNHWAYTVNGGHFDRDAYLDIFTDLTRAIGTPTGNNPQSPSIAAPLTPAQFDAATCSSPAVVEHVYDPVYSPHGEHRAITFCDGEPPIVVCDDSTVVEWCAAAALAGHQIAQRSDANLFCATHGGNPHEADEHSSKPAEQDAFFNNHGMVAGCWNG
ncbi:MAG: hypothetical protein JST92_19980, partial [Deltaproteobacteria bacterium]|nr:hypothetical protein [Deltaproteobacteria bacterium]